LFLFLVCSVMSSKQSKKRKRKTDENSDDSEPKPKRQKDSDSDEEDHQNPILRSSLLLFNLLVISCYSHRQEFFFGRTEELGQTTERKADHSIRYVIKHRDKSALSQLIRDRPKDNLIVSSLSLVACDLCLCARRPSSRRVSQAIGLMDFSLLSALSDLARMISRLLSVSSPVSRLTPEERRSLTADCLFPSRSSTEAKRCWPTSSKKNPRWYLVVPFLLSWLSLMCCSSESSDLSH